MQQTLGLFNPNHLGSSIYTEYPDFDTISEKVKRKYESLPTKVNVFRMLAYSQGTFIELMDLTDAIFKRLKLSDYHRELLILMVSDFTRTDYIWDQHVVISQAAGVSEDQILAIAEHRNDDSGLFTKSDIILMRFGQFVLEQGKAPAVIFKRTLEEFTIEELSDAMIVMGFYSMLSCFMKTLNIPIDQQEDGRWIKR